MSDQHTPPAPGDAMKTPIEPEDIREGDLIRCESIDPGSVFGSGSKPLVASEFIAGRGFRHADHARSVRYFLLDRPKPAIELPTKPTLGWLTTKYGERILARWGVRGSLVEAADVYSSAVEEITDFTRAVAVPAEALEKLRDRAWPHSAPVADFLDAVVAANGDDR